MFIDGFIIEYVRLFFDGHMIEEFVLSAGVQVQRGRGNACSSTENWRYIFFKIYFSEFAV